MGNIQKQQNLNKYLEAPEVSARISEKLGLEEAKRFRAALSSACSTNPVLLNECIPSTVVNSGLIGHSLNLPPSPQLGYYYIVPYWDKRRKSKVAQFQLGYKGYIQLAMRSGYYKKLNVAEIKEGEFISWNPLTEELEVEFKTNPAERENLQTVGYCGYFEYLNGFTKSVYWTIDGIRIHADRYAPAFSLEAFEKLNAGKIPKKELWKYSSFWYSDFDMMGKKTVIRHLLGKWGMMSIEMQQAYEHDIKADGVSFEETQTANAETIREEAGTETIDSAFEEDIPEEAEQPEEENGTETAEEDWLNNLD